MLRKGGVYHRLKSSLIYDLYWRIGGPSVIDDRSREVAFYKRTLQGLQPADLVFDVGANRGYKTDIFLRLGARVVAIDPDEENQRILRERFLKYRIVSKPVIVEPLAVGESVAVETLWLNSPGSAKNTLSTKWVDILRSDQKRFEESLTFGATRKVRTTTLDDLIARYGTPFYVKIDVEGYELPVLRGLNRLVPYVSFEVNLPEFVDEGLGCIEKLHRLDPRGLFNFTYDARRGMALSSWESFGHFATTYRAITHESVDIFWKSQEPR